MTRADVPIGLLLAVVCLWVFWRATALPYGSELAPGPGFAPLWLSLLGAVFGLLVAANAWRIRGRAVPPSEMGGRPGLARVAAGLGGSLAMMLLVPALGLLPALLTYLVFLSLAVERLSPWLGLGISVGTVSFIYLVFGRALGVPFPTGPLGF